MKQLLIVLAWMLLSACQQQMEADYAVASPAISADASEQYNDSSDESDDMWENHQGLKQEFDELYNGEYATNPDDVPVSEYDGNVGDFYIGDLLIRDGQLYTERCGRGELLVIAKNDRQRKLKDQLIDFVKKHDDVSVNVNIRGYISNDTDLVLVNYTALKANKTCNFFKLLKQLADEE